MTNESIKSVISSIALTSGKKWVALHSLIVSGDVEAFQLKELSEWITVNTNKIIDKRNEKDDWIPRKPTTSPIPPQHKCKFDNAWIGICSHLVSNEGDKCAEHSKIKCGCGEQATHTCGHTSQFVCGTPLCDSCAKSHRH